MIELPVTANWHNQEMKNKNMVSTVIREIDELQFVSFDGTRERTYHTCQY